MSLGCRNLPREGASMGELDCQPSRQMMAQGCIQRLLSSGWVVVTPVWLKLSHAGQTPGEILGGGEPFSSSACPRRNKNLLI